MSHTVIMFPGMGAQYAGMMSKFIKACPEQETLINQVIDERAIYGFCTRLGLVPDAIFDELKVQLSIHALNLAWWERTKSKFSDPVFCGHSLGLYAALVAAGYLSVEDSRNLIIEVFLTAWKQFSQNEKRTCVATTFKPIDQSILVKCGIEAIALNNYSQTLIYADEDAIQQWVKGNGENILGVKWMDNRVPFHSCEMGEACLSIEQQFIDDLDFELTKEGGRGRVFSHIEAREILDEGDVRWHLAHQLRLPVRWLDMIEALAAEGPTEFVEVGPGRILSQMVRWIDKSIKARAVDSHKETNHVH